MRFLILFPTFFLILFEASALPECSSFLRFLQDFVILQRRPTEMILFVNLKKSDKLLCCSSKAKIGYKCFLGNENSFNEFGRDEHILYVLDLQSEEAVNILSLAEKTRKLFNPSRWLLIHDMGIFKNDTEILLPSPTHHRQFIENKLNSINIAFHSEIYVTFKESQQSVAVYLIHKNRCHLPMKWKLYGTWHAKSGIKQASLTKPLAMTRRNLEGLQLVTTAVILNNRSLKHMTDYRERDVDSLSKVVHYLAIHLFEWMNATGFFNTTASWGYLQHDGTYDGVIRELQEGRSEFSGTVLIQKKDRMFAVEYVLPPAELSLDFIFRKPALASIANIYVLPFTHAVWMAMVMLILILASALVVASFWELKSNERREPNIFFQIMEGFLDILCCVFQQGTAFDPVSVTSRQILLLGLMVFMFLYTAYAANVVALLQSTTNDINSVAALLGSPLQCGAHDVLYNRVIFTNENRPLHRAFYLKKGLPQGERFFLTVEDGIRRVRQGMYAFHVEPTAGFDMIQKTFLEHEKCNIGSIKYTDFKTPYFGVARNSPFKEALRIGTPHSSVIRIMESGVQDRTNRRITAGFPSCSVGAGMFTAVDILDVAPAFKCLLALYMLALGMFAMEVIVYRRKVNRNNHQLKNNASLPLDSE